MAAVILLAFALAVAQPSAVDPVDRWSEYIVEASNRFGIPQAWIRQVMRAESGGHTRLNGRPISSPAGAQGLMQLMPGTWSAMRMANGLGADPHDPRDNILAGTAYLRAMYDRYGYPGLFAAYNAGPGRYAEHLATGRRLPAETVAYVSAVAGRGDVATPAAEERQASSIFVALAAPRRQEEAAAPPESEAQSLFVHLDSPPAQSE
jgi:soluble lytic murein transglycosylase-like protein